MGPMKFKQKLKHIAITFAFCALDSHLLSLLLIILPPCQLSDACVKDEQADSQKTGRKVEEKGY